MQNDILPPKLQRPNTKISPHEPMRSLRLRGHSLDDARERLQGAEKHPSSHSHVSTDHSDVHAEEIAAVINKNKPKSRIKHFLSKRTKIELAALLILMVGAIGLVYSLFIYHKRLPPKPAIKQPVVKVEAAPPKKTTVASPLSGLEVAPELAARPVTGIMIENSLDARPQSGLQDAGTVYEAIAEGGITRFLALFQDTSPQYVGPVRSLRPYYLDFAAAYQASIAHVGGSPDALSQVRSGAYRDIDQFFNSGSYWRISARYAPHNVYTSFANLDALNQKKGYAKSEYTPWKRKDEKPAATATASHIDVKISSPLYYSHYDYDKASNSYLRSEGGRPHLQLTSANDRAGVQIHPKVVLTLVMSYKVIDRAGHSGYGTTGSGTMYAFQDGTVTQGTWSKADRNSMLEFKDASGQPLALDSGQVWVTIVSAPSQVASSP
jgi:hypothetical protein